jgi:glycosyltransferase involved in cell wall biosynthesis
MMSAASVSQPGSVRLMQVFNRYLHPGGEEKSVDRIYKHLSERHEVARCLFDSAEWKQPGAPGILGQGMRLFYNADSRRRFETALDQHHSQVSLFHNLYPVASPSLYRAAMQRRLPVIQYLHNFRPFCVSGTAYARGQILPEALRGHYWREVKYASWQDSMMKSLLFALMLKWLHASGWLQSVKAWVAISEFMRDRLIEAGVPADRIVALRHSWDAMAELPEIEDAGYYLYLARLVEVKGVAPLLQAWAQLRQQLGERTPELRIAGEGPLESLVREQAASNPSVKCLGRISGVQKQEALRCCRAMTVPSTWWEPLGLVVYEAYDFAKPVLAARSGGLIETVLPEQTGLLHSPGMVGEIVRDVLSMEMRSRHEREAMGRAGREWLLHETTVKAWQDSFDEVIEVALR